jgi:hypothetical protein
MPSETPYANAPAGPFKRMMTAPVGGAPKPAAPQAAPAPAGGGIDIQKILEMLMSLFPGGSSGMSIGAQPPQQAPGQPPISQP